MNKEKKIIEKKYKEMQKRFPDWKEKLDWEDEGDVYMFSPKQVLEMMEQTKKEILDIINKDRDNGNIEEGGFSPALCLSKIIKYCEDGNEI